MKQNERIIRNGDYYELETIEDIMMQQKIIKKQEPQSLGNIAPPPGNIITELPSRKEALNSYFIPSSASIKSDDFGLNEYQTSLEYLLKQPIADQERLEIEKLLKQIEEIKHDGQLPLNNLPQPVPYKKPQGAKNIPRQINLKTNIKIDGIQKQVAELEGLKFMELSRLEHIIDILLGEIKTQIQPPQATQLDQKVKSEVEATYNNLNSLTCLKALPSILNKISFNEIKFEEMNEWVEKTEQISDLNKNIRDQFEHDEIVLKQLQASFKSNIEKVKATVKKLNE